MRRNDLTNVFKEEINALGGELTNTYGISIEELQDAALLPAGLIKSMWIRISVWQ